MSMKSNSPLRFASLFRVRLRNIFFFFFFLCGRFNALFGTGGGGGGGGLPAGAITEFVGPAAIGKTQLCMWCAANVASSNEGKSVLYISSSNSFAPERVVSFVPPHASIEDVLERIHVVNCFEYEQLMGLLHQLRDDVQWAGRGATAAQTPLLDSIVLSSLSLIIIDSINPLLQPILGKQPFGHSLMFSLHAILKDIAATFGASIIVTNTTVVADFNGPAKTPGAKSSMGPSWELVCNPRLWFDFDEPNHKHHAILTMRGAAPLYIERRDRKSVV